MKAVALALALALWPTAMATPCADEFGQQTCCCTTITGQTCCAYLTFCGGIVPGCPCR